MKKLLKLVGILLGIVVLSVALLVATCSVTWPPDFSDTPMPDIAASDDPEVIERGAYLVNAVAHCAACHTPAEEYTKSKPGDVLPLKGGHEWHMGPLGTLRSVNITPDEKTGIGGHSDAELARAIRHGVRRDGKPALFMFAVGGMTDEDLTAIISYLRTLEPVENQSEPHDVGLMGKVLFQGPMEFFAAPHTYPVPPHAPKGETSVERGRYLAEGPAFCSSCHSDVEMGEQGLEFKGQANSGNVGNPFPDESDPDYKFYAPNLTPDQETGHIAGWTKEQFMERFRAGRAYAATPMPWESYANMTDSDLESIWMYLQSLPPTKKAIGVVRRKGDEKPGE